MGLIMLDLDGTLIEDALHDLPVDGGGTKLGRLQHQQFTDARLKPNVYDRLKEFAKDGDSFAIVTNQGGVALGFHTQAEVYQRIANTVAQLAFFWGRPWSLHVAWMLPSGYVPGFKGDDGRKPARDMLLRAMGAADYKTFEDVVMVGDRDEDEKAAEAAGVTFTPAYQFFGW